MHLLIPGYRVSDANAKVIAVPLRSVKEVIVSCQEHISFALFRAGQMQSVERAKAKLLKKEGTLGGAGLWDHYLIGKAQQRSSIMAPVCVRAAADFDLDCDAAYPGCLAFPDQAKDAFNRLSFATNAGLALIIC